MSKTSNTPVSPARKKRRTATATGAAVAAAALLATGVTTSQAGAATTDTDTNASARPALLTASARADGRDLRSAGWRRSPASPAC